MRAQGTSLYDRCSTTTAKVNLPFLCPVDETIWNYPQSTYIYRVQSSVWRLWNYWPPHPLSTQRVHVSSPRTKGGGYRLAGRWGGGGSIFRKTPNIGLASYSIIPLRLQPKNIYLNIEALYKHLWSFGTSFVNNYVAICARVRNEYPIHKGRLLRARALLRILFLNVRCTCTWRHIPIVYIK
jgi:hypothetical protein